MAVQFDVAANEIFAKMFSGILWVGLAVLVIGVLGGVGYYLVIYKRKFDINVTIHSERADDNENIIFDKAAILRDRKTKADFFRLLNSKVDLPCPPFNVMQKTNKGDYIELRRTTQNHFFFLTPKRIIKSQIIKADGKVYPVSSQQANMIDPDMNYWAAKRKGQNNKMFDPENLLMKILPFIPIILGGAIMIFILYILMQYLPSLLSELTKLAEALNKQQTAVVTTGLFMPLI